MSSKPIKITKLSAAIRQLDLAIELWFREEDAVSVHTLTMAAYQVISDICGKNGLGHHLLFGSDYIKDEHRKEFIRLVKRPSNFFKHADTDPDPDSTIDFNPESTLSFLTFGSIGLRLLGHPESENRQALYLWTIIHYPKWLSDAFREKLSHESAVKIIENTRAIGKREFLEHFRQAKRLVSS